MIRLTISPAVPQIRETVQEQHRRRGVDVADEIRGRLVHEMISTHAPSQSALFVSYSVVAGRKESEGGAKWRTVCRFAGSSRIGD